MQDIKKDKKCQTILSSKLERLSKPKSIFWKNYCKKLEEGNVWKIENGKEEIKDALTPNLYYKLIEEFFPEAYKRSMQSYFSEADVKVISAIQSPKTIGTANSVIGSESESLLSDTKKPRKTMMTSKSNPYLNFFKRNPLDVPIWREDFDPSERHQKRLSKVNDKLTEILTNNVLEIFNILRNEYEDSEMESLETVKRIMDTSMISAFSKTVKVEIKEEASVPEHVARSRRLPERSRRAMLHREIAKDKKASKRKANLIAFGKMLPPEIQRFPSSKYSSERWLKVHNLPESVASMATVWQGITHLNSTKGFCHFLYNYCPGITPPKYLTECGMMNPRNFVNKSFLVVKKPNNHRFIN